MLSIEHLVSQKGKSKKQYEIAGGGGSYNISMNHCVNYGGTGNKFTFGKGTELRVKPSKYKRLEGGQQEEWEWFL